METRGEESFRHGLLAARSAKPQSTAKMARERLESLRQLEDGAFTHKC